MSDSSQPVQTTAAAGSGLTLSAPAWNTEPDDVAFGCECADPSLQIASWGQEAALSYPAALS